MDEQLSRRALLTACGAVITGGTAVSMLPSIAVRAAMSPGVARTVAIDPPADNPSRSRVVDLTGVDDPDGTRGTVAYVTSSGTETTHYAFSIVNVRKQRLTVADIDSLSYDYYLADGTQNTVGSRTEVGPDEVWLIVQGPNTGGRTELFRTWNQPRATGTWHTRAVDAEFSGLARSPWKELSQQTKDFEEVGTDLIDAYGDARVQGVGFGRGDPKMGPSTLDIYYDALQLNGETYSFPTAG